MITYQDQKDLPFSAQFLYAIVADVEQYPSFLPWCQSVHIKSQTDNIICAELAAKFGPFQSAYTSKIILQPTTNISVLLEEGPFNRLVTGWHFREIDAKTTHVSFDLSFEFKSFLMQQAAKLVFDKAARQMMQAFKERAHELNCTYFK